MRLTGSIVITSLALGGFLAVKSYARNQKSSGRPETAAKRVTPRLTHEMKDVGLQWGSPVFMRAFKEEKILELWLREPQRKTYKLFRTYPILAASGTVGPKLKEGDRQVPEGFYTVSAGQMNPHSRFHLAFNIGYPNKYDRKKGRTGSFIMVHGSNVSIGCLAMGDPAIEEIFTICDTAHKNGQKKFKIHIFPFKLSKERLLKENGKKWHGFWQNLYEGQQIFETKKIPPGIKSHGTRYIFAE